MPTVVIATDFAGFGGGERMTLERARGLRQHGWSVVLVAPGGELRAQARADGTTVEENEPSSVSAVEVLRRWRPDIVHLVSYGPTTRRYASAARRLRIPVVITVSALSFPGGYRSRRFVTSSSAVMAASETVRSHIEARVAELPLLVTVLDVPLDAHTRVPGREPFARRQTHGTIVGWVGRFDPVKRLEDAVQAFAALHAADPSARLLVAASETNYSVEGTARYRERVEAEISAYGLEAAVSIHSSLDVYRLLDDVDIFLLTSERETFSRVTFEAMMMGRPIVATRAGAVPDLIRDGREGILVDVGDTEGLGEALLMLYAQTELARRLGAAGRERALALSRTHARIEPVTDVYTAAIADRRRQGAARLWFGRPRRSTGSRSV